MKYRYNITADTTFFTADWTGLTADFDPYALVAHPTRSIEFYTGKITPWQANPTKARFVETVRANIQPYSDLAAVIADMPRAYDLDEAVGAQLDVDGLWVGMSRFIPIPAPNTLFSFDVDGLGWDQGYIDGPYDSAQGLSTLSDEDYRRLLYAKILANSWDGSADSLLKIIRVYLFDDQTKIFVQDNSQAIPVTPELPIQFAFDVEDHGFDDSFVSDVFQYPGNAPDAATISYAVVFSGKIPSDLDLYVIDGVFRPLVSAIGSEVDFGVTSIDDNPVFGFDLDDDKVSGFDSGAIDVPPLVAATLS
jgi:hypothetical protein